MLLSHVQHFVTPWTAACQASLYSTISVSLLKLMSVESVIPSKHFILLLLPSIFPSIKVFFKESALYIAFKWHLQLITLHLCPLVAQLVKNPPAMRDLDLIPGLGRSPWEGNSYPLQYSCLENSMDRGAWQTTVHGVAKSWTWLSHFHSLTRSGIISNPDDLSYWRLPRWLSGKESVCQCRRCRKHGFNPWVGKIQWRKKWQATPVFLSGKFHGHRSGAGYSPWGRKELDTT